MGKKKSKKLRPKGTKPDDPNKSSMSAKKAFGGQYYDEDDWKALKKRHPGGFQATLVGVQEHEFGYYAELKGHDKRAKIIKESGREMAKTLGDDMSNWGPVEIHVTPVKIGTYWTSTMDLIEDMEEEDDDDIPFDDEDDDEVD